MIDILEDKTLDNIYLYLDSNTRIQFSKTSKRYFQLHHKNQKLIFAAKFIKKYCIINTNINESLPFWISLKDCQVFLFGEVHTNDLHRKIFSVLVNQLWEKNHSYLLFEGIGEEQSIYIQPEIKKHSSCWDTHPVKQTIFKELHTNFFEILQQAYSIFSLKHLSETFSEDVENILDIFKIGSHDTHLNQIIDNLNGIKFIRNLVKFNKYDLHTTKVFAAFLEKARLSVILLLCDKLDLFFLKQIKTLSNKIVKADSLRMNAMIENIHKKLNKLIFINAGQNHVKIESNPILSQGLIQNKYMSLIPYNKINVTPFDLKEIDEKIYITKLKEYRPIVLNNENDFIKEFLKNNHKIQNTESLYIWLESMKKILPSFQSKILHNFSNLEIVIKNQEFSELNEANICSVDKWMSYIID
ncbi:MAG: hypothetical protein Q8K60_07445 [Parachlamydiaceae bacterium]|nr:hypothetical protein [Parachlamydiaceae bacterium]